MSGERGEAERGDREGRNIREGGERGGGKRGDEMREGGDEGKRDI